MSLVENLKRDFGDFEVNIPKWEIADEGITALWGPSGSGKTTVFRLMMGLEACPGLKWIFDGKDLAKIPTPQRRLGVVFQNLELFPHMTAWENMNFALEARRLDLSEGQQKIEELAKLLKISDVIDKPVHVLSGGERQRVALARALVGEPRFLFLDEPFSSLDADIKVEARKLVKRVITKMKVPTLLITHDPEDIEELAHTKVTLRRGRIYRR